MFGKSPSPLSNSPSPPVAPPRTHKAPHPPPIPPKPDSRYILTLQIKVFNVLNQYSHFSRTPSPDEAAPNLLGRPDLVSAQSKTFSSAGPPSDGLLLDLGFNEVSCPSNEAKVSSHSSTQSFDILLDFGGNTGSLDSQFEATSATDLFGNNTKTGRSNFGSLRSSPTVDLFGISTNSSQASPTIDLIGNVAAPTPLQSQSSVHTTQNQNAFGDLFGDFAIHTNSSKPVLSPVNTFQVLRCFSYTVIFLQDP